MTFPDFLNLNNLVETSDNGTKCTTEKVLQEPAEDSSDEGKLWKFDFFWKRNTFVLCITFTNGWRWNFYSCLADTDILRFSGCKIQLSEQQLEESAVLYRV